MTTNIDRAAEVVQKTLGCMAISGRDAAYQLAKAGLLAPVLPRIDDQDWVGVDSFGGIFARGVDDLFMTPGEARNLALALLAAADYAEGVGRADA